jgi:hypothetical protein
MFAIPTVAPAQPGHAQGFLVGYGILTVAAVGRLIRGNGEADVAPGSRVRVRLVSGTFEGQVASISTDSLVVENPTGSRAFANADLDELGVSVGIRPRWAQGFVCGLVIGGLAGAALGLSSGNHPGSSSDPGQNAAIGGVILGMTGSMVGTIFGGMSSAEAWANPRRPIGGRSLAVTPVLGRRTGVSVRMTF